MPVTYQWSATLKPIFNPMWAHNIYKDILFGIAIGDALGVPFEFTSRATIAANPVTAMIGYGTHDVPPGTFSDDSSLTFCLAEVLAEGYDLQKIANNFVRWLNQGYWTAHGVVFDVGIATSLAIGRLETGCRPELAGGAEISDNGNGSLMRILPLVVYTKDMDISERYKLAKEVSSITHGHIRSVIGCFYYLEFAKGLIEGMDKFKIYEQLQSELPQLFRSQAINTDEIIIYNRLLFENISNVIEDQIFSTGYVMHTLEASIWSLLTTNNYAQATLKAVNLGLDTDTTGAVTGGLAGLLYGWESLPKDWMHSLARIKDIEDLADRWKSRAQSPEI